MEFDSFRSCIARIALVHDGTDKAHFRLRAARCQTNARQRKLLERLLEAGHSGAGGGFLGGMSSDKYAKMTATSKATAKPYAVNVPGWEQPHTERRLGKSK